MSGDGHTLECYNRRAIDDAIERVLQMRVNRGLNKRLYKKPNKMLTGRSSAKRRKFEMSLNHAA